MADAKALHSEIAPGVFRVHYETGGDLAPELQTPLLHAIEAVAVTGARSVIAFVLEPGIRTVDVSVPTWWLGVTSRRELRLAAFAIISRSVGVKAAAKGFAIANMVRGLPIKVCTFEDEAEGLTWARGMIKQ